MANVEPEDRKSTGFDDGSYPVATTAQCLSAIKLRHNSKSHSAAEVLSHVARSKHGSEPRVKAAIKKAREADRAK